MKQNETEWNRMTHNETEWKHNNAEWNRMKQNEKSSTHPAPPKLDPDNLSESSSFRFVGLPGACSGLLGLPGAAGPCGNLLGLPAASWISLGLPGMLWNFIRLPGACWPPNLIQTICPNQVWWPAWIGLSHNIAFAFRNQSCIAKPSFFHCVFLLESNLRSKAFVFHRVSRLNCNCIAKPLYFHCVFSLEPFKPPLVHWIIRNIWMWPWTFGVSIPIVKASFLFRKWIWEALGYLGGPKGVDTHIYRVSACPAQRGAACNRKSTSNKQGNTYKPQLLREPLLLHPSFCVKAFPRTL